MPRQSTKRSSQNARERGIGPLFYRSLAAWALSDLRRTLACAPVAWRLYLQIRRRARVIEQRRRKRIVLVRFPHDEYGAANRCSAAGRHSIHIGSRGEVEPCPFVSVSCENVRNGRLTTAPRPPFLRSIREGPELLARHALACALFEHPPEIERIANRIRSPESEKS